MFENPTDPTERQIFVQKGGDWTTQVHDTLQRDTVRPVWVQGPFPSPYDSADAYDNQILVASGIGITPALSVIRAHKDHRRINLIWAVRDRHLLQFFLRHLYLDHEGWNLIFYTGKEALEEDEMESFANTNICIIHGRPTLSTIVPNIIYGIESGKGRPEHYVPQQKAETLEKLADIVQRQRNKKTKRGQQHHYDSDDDDVYLEEGKHRDDDETASITTTQMMATMTRVAAERGFQLQPKDFESARSAWSPPPPWPA